MKWLLLRIWLTVLAVMIIGSIIVGVTSMGAHDWQQRWFTVAIISVALTELTGFFWMIWKLDWK